MCLDDHGNNSTDESTGVADDVMTSILAYIGAWAATTAGVWALFERLEQTASKRAKAGLSGWLQNLGATPRVLQWPAQVNSAFVAIFGQSHTSWRCILRSVLLSMFAVGILLLLALATDRTALGYFALLLPRLHEGQVLAMVFIFALATATPDYVALLETRIVLRRMQEISQRRGVVSWLFVDLLLTTLLAMVAIAVFKVAIAMWAGITFGQPWPYERLATQFLSTFSAHSLPGRVPLSAGVEDDYITIGLAPWYYGTFTSSIWLWLYAITGLIVRSMHRFNRLVALVPDLLDVRRQPFKSMGMVSVLLVTFLFIAFAPFIG